MERESAVATLTDSTFTVSSPDTPELPQSAPDRPVRSMYNCPSFRQQTSLGDSPSVSTQQTSLGDSPTVSRRHWETVRPSADVTGRQSVRQHTSPGDSPTVSRRHWDSPSVSRRHWETERGWSRGGRADTAAVSVSLPADTRRRDTTAASLSTDTHHAAL